VSVSDFEAYLSGLPSCSITAPNPYLEASTCSMRSLLVSKNANTGPGSLVMMSFIFLKAASCCLSHTNSLSRRSSCLRGSFMSLIYSFLSRPFQHPPEIMVMFLLSLSVDQDIIHNGHNSRQTFVNLIYFLLENILGCDNAKR